MTDCALYYGWYAEKIAGPFVQSDFKFARGALAVHIHSFSASTLRDRAGELGRAAARRKAPRPRSGMFTSRISN